MKKAKLKALEKRIIRTTPKETWFYPEHNEVKGWLGIQDIMFVGPNPSCNIFPSRHTDFFYDQLKKNGFKNAHLTDLIKIRAKNNEADMVIDETFNEQIKFLKEEINIIKPKLIVIMGSRAKRVLEKFNYKDERFRYIYHYSTQGFPRNKEGFIKGMGCVKKLYF
jgi:uracil-DNA glycosylase